MNSAMLSIQYLIVTKDIEYYWLQTEFSVFFQAIQERFKPIYYLEYNRELNTLFLLVQLINLKVYKITFKSII